VRTREDAGDAASVDVAAAADLIYLSGGKPDHLYDLLVDTPLLAALRTAWQRGAVLAGCSAGAMVLAGQRMSFGTRMPMPSRWRGRLGGVPGGAVAAQSR